MDEKCICGKTFSFKTREEAEEFLLSPRAIKYLSVKRAYRCRQNRSVFHVTSSVYHKTDSTSSYNRLKLEMRIEMATIKEWVITYMGNAYKNRNTVEFSPGEIRDAFAKENPNMSPDSVHGAIYQLKQAGTIVDLGKQIIPGKKGNFITLTKIMEKETNPVSKKTVAVPTQKEVSTAPEPPKPVNPFDTVKEQLNEILAVVKGLAQGYSELSVLENERHKVNGKSFNQVLEAVTSLSLKSTPVPLEIDATIIADAVNLRLKEYDKDDSFIYWVRDEIQASKRDLNDTLGAIYTKISELPVPSSVANTDDYREGIKEGIRLATEMGLMIRNAE